MCREKIILILAAEDDYHAQWVAGALTAKGRKAVILDTRRIGPQYSLRFGCDETGAIEFAELYIGNEVINCMSDIVCVYWRTFCGVHGETAEDLHNARSMVLSWLRLLSDGIQFINPPNAYERHWQKPRQFVFSARRARVLKFPLTSWHLGRPSYAWHKDAIVKPAQGGSEIQRIGDTHFFALDRSKAWTVQDYIKGTHCRIYTVDGKFAVYSIQSDYVDWRNDQNPHILYLGSSPGHLLGKGDLDADLVTLSLRNGCRFGAFDLVLGENNDLYFLELNPSPMFLGFGNEVGRLLVDLLDGIGREDEDESEEEQEEDGEQ